MKFFSNLFNQIKAFLLPKEYFSWQAVIYLSVFSWAMSWIALGVGARSFTVWLLTTASWLFLSIGVGWGLEANKIKPFGIALAPWASAAIICLFFAAFLRAPLSSAIVIWPIVAVIIGAVPHFLTWELKLKSPPPPIRQQLILAFLISVLLSCWFQFYFRLQQWFADYPSLLADNFGASGFVFQVPGGQATLPQGIVLLNLTEAVIQTEVGNRPWSSVARWVLNLEEQKLSIIQKVRDRITEPYREHDLWKIDVQQAPSPEDSIQLLLKTIWTGPTAESNGYYYLEKTCILAPTPQRQPPPGVAANRSGVPETTAQAVNWAKFSCEPIPRRYLKQPTEGTSSMNGKTL